MNYVVITPVRNEAQHFARTIASMTAQTRRPSLWIIVNDGSTDATGAIADQAAAEHAWIRVVHRPDRGARKPGGGVIDTFYDGFALISQLSTLNSQPSVDAALPLRAGERAGVRCTDDSQLSTFNPQPSIASAWQFLAKLDGDLCFPPEYFAHCLDHFAADPRLGIGGGRVYGTVNGVEVEDSPGDPVFHVRGATKIYRRACWDAIGGLVRAPGWDTLDELKANMLGWRTQSFRGLKVLQLKPTGSADGSWRNWFKNGRANYLTGYHPLFMLMKCLKRLPAAPVGIGAAGLFCGFVSGYLKRVPPIADPALVQYLRRQQLNRLFFRESLWG